MNTLISLKQPNLLLKTQLKQVLGSLPLDLTLPGQMFFDQKVWNPPIGQTTIQHCSNLKVFIDKEPIL